MASVLPRNNNERLSWIINFKTKFPAVAAANNFTPEQIAEVLEACDTITFAVTLAIQAKIFSKACTTYRNAILKSERAKQQPVPKLTLPGQPPTLAPSNAIGYLQKMIQLLKVQPTYSPSVGVGLQIVTSAAQRISEENAKPSGKIKSLTNSVLRIDWVKRGFDGVIIESRRGDELEYTELSRDFQSPFIDTRPPLVAGQPEIRYYRLIYIFNDKPYGKYSNIFEMVTMP